MTRHLAAIAAGGLLLAGQGCSVGEGWGRIDGCIHLPGCSLDPDGDQTEGYETCTEDRMDLHLKPDFFAAEVLEDGSITIRAQVGGYRLGESDGVLITVPDHAWAAEHAAGDVDVVPEDGRLAVAPLEDLQTLPIEQRFKVTLYVNGSCPDSNVSFAQGVGEIWFFSMYQARDLGDERDVSLIHLGFELDFVDPWPFLEPGPSSPRIHAVGEMEFHYKRGSPAQQFP